MESISLQQKEIAKDLLEQISGAIDNLLEWNKEYSEADDFLKSPGGMKTLAANCMLIEAIGESVKKIDSKTNGLLLCQCAEIPWRNIKGMRDHIAHGYFDINVDFIWDVIQNDLTPVKHAVDYLIKYCE